MAKSRHKGRATRRNSPVSIAQPPQQPTTLPTELIVAIVEETLLCFDDYRVRETQVKLRCLDARPTATEASILQDNGLPPSKTLLLDLSQVSKLFRGRALARLWNELLLDKVWKVALYDSLFASTQGVKHVYGFRVTRVEFMWACHEDGRNNDDFLHSYQATVQPKDTLANCAFSKRTEKVASARAHAVARNQGTMRFSNGWHYITDGPDGRGEVPGVKRPIDLTRALARMFRQMTNLFSLQWDGTVLPIPPLVANAIERTAKKNLVDCSFFNRTSASSRAGNEPRLSISTIPGLTTSLDNMLICDKHWDAIDDEDDIFDYVEELPSWCVVDEDMPFGIRILPRQGPDDYAMPSARWLVETCLSGAQHGLTHLTLTTDKLLRRKELWPLWIWLDLRTDDINPPQAWVDVEGENRSVFCNFEASSRFQALNEVRSAIRQFDGAKVGDWLADVLKPLSVCFEDEEMEAFRQMRQAGNENSDGSDAEAKSENGSIVGGQDVNQRWWEARLKRDIFSTLVADTSLRRRVAKCWEKQQEKERSMS